MWVCVVSDPSKLWMDALIVALYWVFHCRLAAKRLWVGSPGSPGGSEVVFPPAPLGSGGVALACFALLAFPLGTNCTQPWPLCSLLGWPGLQRAEQGAKCHVSRESRALIGDKRWIRVLQEKQARKFWGNFCIFSYWEFDSLWNGATGERRGANGFLCSLGRRQSSKGAGRSWNSPLCLGADGRHCQGQQTPAEQWMEGTRGLPSNNHRLEFNITAVHGLMLTAQHNIIH